MIRTILLTGLLFATAAFAQRGGGDMGGDMGGGGGRGGMSVPSIGPSRPSRLDTWTGVLKLSKDQKKEVKSIMDEGQKQASQLRDQLTKGRDRIAEAVASGQSQEEINQAVKSYSEMEGQMARIELDAFAKIYKLLDSEQKPKSGVVFQMMAGVFSGKNWNEA
jgi:Spy/CpxP family protein refolding chaperone